jgi:hypothetical protein
MLVIFHFPIGKVVVAPAVGTGKGCGGREVRLDECLLLQEPLDGVEDALTRKISVLDIALASRHRGAINYDAVCGLLTECLQDVSSTIFAVFCLFALLLCS